MSMKKSRMAALAGTMWLAAVVVVAVPAFAHSSGQWAGQSAGQSVGGSFVTVKSTHNYAATVNSLQRAIKSNGLMVMGRVNQKAILSMTGLHLEGAESFLVGNPRVGKKLFSMNPAVAAVVPSRISVWANKGTTYIGYFKPSALMGAISPRLAMPGKMLDKKFHMIVWDAAK